MKDIISRVDETTLIHDEDGYRFAMIVEGKGSYDPYAPMCQDDYEYFTSTGHYAEHLEEAHARLEAVREALTRHYRVEGVDFTSAIEEAGISEDVYGCEGVNLCDVTLYNWSVNVSPVQVNIQVKLQPFCLLRDERASQHEQESEVQA